MEIEQLRKEFNQVLANICEHSDRFTNSDHLSALEMSVMISKLNKLIEVATILKYKIQVNEESRKIKITNESPTITEEVILPSIDPIAISVMGIIEKPELNTQTTKTLQVELISESILIKEDIKTEPTANDPIGEKIKIKSSIGDKFLHTPLKSLKDAFSLNDRYLFANELFKKDMGLFNESVKTIDSCKTIIEAHEYLNQFKINFGWDTENDRVISFYELVERRFLHVG